MDGYAGKLLYVNLSSGEIRQEALSEEMARKFIGGPALGARILYDMMEPGVDPLGPDNVIGFLTGPATGSGAPFGSRYTVVCKSPVTGGFNDANSGGFFGQELKRAGFDGVFFTGASEEPVYLWVNDGMVELRSAAHLWGKDCKETEAALREELGDKRVRVSVIGPAGEQLSLISCPINDGHRAPGRGGSGAVMGAKKLKGIAVRGAGQVQVADRDALNKIRRQYIDGIPNDPSATGTAELGTGGATTMLALAGDTPVKNWGGVGIRDFGEANANAVGVQTFDAKYKVRKYACAQCPLGCGAEYKVEDGKWPLAETERPEYETSGAFGALCLNGDNDAILKCNELCNRYGLDTISAGGTVAWVLECYEHGVLSKEELDGIEAEWGRPEALVALTEKIGTGEGCGEFLKLGSAGAAAKLGKGAEYLQAAGGIELPMHDPRFAPGLGRTYSVDPTPGRHVKGGLMMMQLFGPPDAKYNFEGTGPADVAATCSTEVNNASGLCMFMMYGQPGPNTLAEIVAATTGWQFGQAEQDEVGRRSITMRQAFNVREGLAKPFPISQRPVGRPPLTEGPTTGITIPVEQLQKSFYDEIGWDAESGVPEQETLTRLGLDDVATELYG